MERYMWRGKVVAGMLAEYKKRHNEIWPEMTAALNETGVRNYTIWSSGEELFGYYECDSVEKTKKLQSENLVFLRWNDYMKDILILEYDRDGRSSKMSQIFLHK